MELADLINPDLILTDLRSTNRWEVIEEMVDHLIKVGKIKPEDRQGVVEVVKKREQAMSTGIGFGVGLPHASTNLIAEAVGVLGRSKNGISFDALDNQPVYLVLLFLVPIGQFQKHLHTLSNIAKLLHHQELLQEILQAPDAASIYTIIKKYKKGVI
ncbi:MAG: PTS sugar transporter subunit IIA [Verrucomicrobiia bacterium]|jgi:mannitol/fructose-specific phosphotransferase system IIA component (Ntr-type)